jgi:hypothetical protein
MQSVFFVAVTALGIAVLAVLWQFPKLVTGDYADFQIDKIMTDSQGRTEVSISTETSNQTGVTSAFYEGGRYLGGGNGGGVDLYGNPSAGEIRVGFTIDPQATLLIHEGEKVRLRAGERMFYYNYETPDGVQHDGYMEINPPGLIGTL